MSQLWPIQERGNSLARESVISRYCTTVVYVELYHFVKPDAVKGIFIILS